MAMRRRVVLLLTPAQVRAVNAALAYVTAGEPDDWTASSRVHRTALETRDVVHAAMDAAGVDP